MDAISNITRSDVYNLDIEIAKFIVPRLTKFKEEVDTHPVYDPLEFKKTGQSVELTMDAYLAVLQEMIDGFNEKATKEVTDVDQDKVQRALELFSAYFNSLWL